MKHVMIWLVRLYKKFISPLLPPACRFTPTCSEYAIEAFRKRGFFAGMILTVWRILRCNPFGKPGYDPVPETGLIPTILRKDNTSTHEQSASCDHNRDAQENPHHSEEDDATNAEDKSETKSEE